jgi:uncharacterized iron-regulated membrane protein
MKQKSKKNKKGKALKKAILKIHLWLGLASGLIVFILGVTGCLFVFEQEFKAAFRHGEAYVSPEKKTIPLDKLWVTAQSGLPPNEKISRTVVYNNPEKSYVFYAYGANEDGWHYFENTEYYKSVYVNPYTGELLKIHDEKHGFFNIIKMLHWSLLLSTEIGQPITGWATFVFVILIITGIVLWWPKNKKSSKDKAFKLKWKKSTGWKRKNYDLHNVLGFYVTAVALILAFTGMVWSFKWFQGLVYVLGSGTTEPPKIEQMASEKTDEAATFPYQAILEKSKSVYPEADAFGISPAAGPEAPIHVYVQVHEGKYYENHQMQFDQYSGELLYNRPHSKKNFGEKLLHANYDIHVGAILGLPGKIMAFIGSLICASLPLTGFLIWLNKEKKKRKKKKAGRRKAEVGRKREVVMSS